MVHRILVTAFAVASFALVTAPSSAETAASQPAASKAKPTALVTELLRIVDAERDQIAAIRREIATTRSGGRALELQRRIEAVKRETELDLMRTQLTAARHEGRAEVAAVLERVVATLEALRPATGSSSVAR